MLLSSNKTIRDPTLPTVERQQGVQQFDRDQIPDATLPQSTNLNTRQGLEADGSHSSFATQPSLPLDFYQRMAERQYQSYLQRVALQPGGQKLLSELRKREGQPVHEQMKLLLAIEYCDRICAMGRDVLQLFRAYRPSEEGFRGLPANFDFSSSQLLTGLRDHSGNCHHLSGDLTATLADTTNNAWVSARQKLADPHFAALSGRDYKNPRDSLRSMFELPPNIVNTNALGGLLLADMVSSLSQRDYDMMLAAAPAGNPKNLSLQITSFDRTAHRLPDINLERFHLPDSASAPESQVALPQASWFEDLRYAQHNSRLEEAATAYRRKLLQQEQISILPHVFAISDRLEGIFSKPFETLLKQVRQVFVTRECYLTQLVKIGKCTLSEVPVSEITGRELPQIISAALHAFTREDTAAVEEIVQNSLKDYQLSQQQLLATALSADTLHQSYSQSLLMSGEMQEEYVPQIRSLIEERKTTSDSPFYRKNGGVLRDYYDQSFFQDHFRDLTQGPCPILLSVRENKLSGFFIYYLPADIPTEHHLVPHALRERPDISIAELLLANGRGVADNLIRGMLCHLQLTDAEWSSGYAYESNTRSIFALAKRGHLILKLEAANWTNPDGSPELFVRAEIPVSEQKRKDLGPLTQALNRLVLRQFGNV